VQYPKNSRRGFPKAEAVFVIAGVIIFVSVALVQWTERKQEVMEERSRLFQAQSAEYTRRMYLWFNVGGREHASTMSHWVVRYALPNEEAGLAYVEAYTKAVQETGEPPTGNIQLESSIALDLGTKDVPITISTLTRLNSEQPLLYGGQRRYSLPRVDYPVLIERPSLQREGSHVLFLDGRVEFIPYPGRWPMTEKFIKALESLDELKERE